MAGKGKWTGPHLSHARTQEEISKFCGELSAEEFLVTFPDGREEKIFNLAAFCREHDLQRRDVYFVMDGDLRSVKKMKGFKIIKAERQPPKNLPKKRQNKIDEINYPY